MVLICVVLLLAFGLFEHPSVLQKLGLAGVLFMVNGFAVYASVKEMRQNKTEPFSFMSPTVVIAILPFFLMVASGIAIVVILTKNFM